MATKYHPDLPENLFISGSVQNSVRTPRTFGFLCKGQTREGTRDTPELSSFTREDMVLVMESAATSKSFLKFLLEP